MSFIGDLIKKTKIYYEKGGIKVQDHSVNVKMYLPLTLLANIDERCKKLNITRSEYLRMLTMLDISLQKKMKYEQYLGDLNDILNNLNYKLYGEF